MPDPVAVILPDGKRLHLQHGPIDLIIGADGGDVRAAFQAAELRFRTILVELTDELSLLRSPLTRKGPLVTGAVARRMHHAVLPHCRQFVTMMAAVAGAVADEILAAMLAVSDLQRAYVNNGGDIALHLAPGRLFSLAMMDMAGRNLGRIKLSAENNVGGIATSGRGGRSMSFGIADSVTVLGKNAASADVAATLIANAVNIPNHPAIHREPASNRQPDSDLGDRLVTVAVEALREDEITDALGAGLYAAQDMVDAKLISAAALHLSGQSRLAGETTFIETQTDRIAVHA